MKATIGKERAILDAALRLFSHNGYRKTSVDEIAAAAGIGKGTIYLYFASKEALFRALCTHVIEHVFSDVRETIGDDGHAFARIAAALRVKSGRFFRMVASAPYGRELVESRDEHAADLFRAFDERFESLVVELVERGLLRAELRRTADRLTARAIAQTLLAAARGVALAARDPADFDRRFEALLAVLREGLTA